MGGLVDRAKSKQGGIGDGGRNRKCVEREEQSEPDGASQTTDKVQNSKLSFSIDDILNSSSGAKEKLMEAFGCVPDAGGQDPEIVAPGEPETDPVHRDTEDLEIKGNESLGKLEERTGMVFITGSDVLNRPIEARRLMEQM